VELGVGDIIWVASHKLRGTVLTAIFNTWKDPSCTEGVAETVFDSLDVLHAAEQHYEGGGTTLARYDTSSLRPG
jgi:hypothetical protein